MWYVLPSGENPGPVVFKCDNEAVVRALSSRAVQDPMLMHLLRCLFFLEAHFGFEHRGTHIAGKLNGAADALSRDNLQPYFDLYPQAPKMPLNIPHELYSLLSNRSLDWTSQHWKELFRDTLRAVSQRGPGERIRQQNGATSSFASKASTTIRACGMLVYSLPSHTRAGPTNCSGLLGSHSPLTGFSRPRHSPNRSMAATSLCPLGDQASSSRHLKDRPGPVWKGCGHLPRRSGQALCPVVAILNFLAVRPQGGGPLLIHQNGSPLSRDSFVANALKRSGVDQQQYTGHSFMIGAAASVAAAEVPAHIIKNGPMVSSGLPVIHSYTQRDSVSSIISYSKVAIE